ncbi:hypothetical protein MANES_15G083233v8 [Manihot esculenta]|uniref:Uncharacterized protein n=1 Tax=Manihot esculenta TaxID=3983 RepID=A0ACB7GAR9_MANES|nr:hypothetical protein MANES_15G083233v8 [Manihot esculenta]
MASSSSSFPSSSSSSSSSLFFPGLVVSGERCFYCMSQSAYFRRGWQLRCGNYAGLCDRCAGSFCIIFHWSSNGWRSCVACEKLVHCGCIMSEHTHVILDEGGIKCMDCLTKEFIQESGTQECQSSSDGASKAIGSN